MTSLDAPATDTHDRVKSVSIVYPHTTHDLTVIGNGFADALRGAYQSNEIDFEFSQIQQGKGMDERKFALDQKPDLALVFTPDIDRQKEVQEYVRFLVTQARSAFVIAFSEKHTSDTSDWAFALYKQLYPLQGESLHPNMRVGHFVKALPITFLQQNDDKKLTDFIISVAQETLDNQERLQNLNLRD